ncbi:WAP four-disulfide core domain protein 2-like isoform X2 [Manduca sexta]|uniref:WAP four-disulfide core domain protein 2-like isoform X2 n=1 Tax=Manduca sexta TaxID=7130 RepID=UPI00188ED91A|nr:WAP four-disulfide core domain protein 2-like isoform X2 [Manduca sexta]
MSRFFVFFFLASFLVALSASMPSDDGQGRVKAGECPSDVGIISTCTNTCKFDYNCPDSSKCCRWGCAWHCVPAVNN